MFHGLQIEKSSKSSSATEGDLCTGAGSSDSGSTFLFLTARRFTGLAALVGCAADPGFVALVEEEGAVEEKCDLFELGSERLDITLEGGAE